MKFLNKRIISLLLAMVMLCGMMPMTALATEEAESVCDHTYENGSCIGCEEKDPNKLELNGLNVLCLGDSITAGQGLTTETRWTNVLASKYGWNLTNKSQGGISMTSYYYTANGKTDVSIAKKAEVLKTMTTKPDVIIVWGGHNDTSYRYSPLGTWYDETTDSFKGALKHIAELADEYAPDATLFVLTPLWTTEAPSTLKVPENTTDNNWMFVDAIYEGADIYGWIPINMDLCGITPFTKSGLLLDSIHPNEAGTEKIVEYLSEELASYGSNSKKQTILFNHSSVSIDNGKTTTLKAVLSPRSGNGSPVFTWSSSNSSVATVDANGKITAVAHGNATITATADNDVSATVQVSVAEGEHTYESTVTAPTCTEKGYTTYTCACGDSYVDDYVDATGIHTKENGICTVCGTGLFLPVKISYIGNSLLAGSGHGMAASAPDKDYYYLVNKYIEDVTGTVPITTGRIRGNDFESATTLEVAIEHINTMVGKLSGEEDCVIIQLGDNVKNSSDVFPTSCKMLLEAVRQKCPKARVFWAGMWYSGNKKLPVIEQACAETGVQFISFKAYAGLPENCSYVGAVQTRSYSVHTCKNVTKVVENTPTTSTYNITVTFELNSVSYEATVNCISYSLDSETSTLTYRGTEYIVNSTAVASHPNDEGLRKIANSILYETGMCEDPEYYRHAHNYKSIVTAPTCTEQGYTTYTCECGDSYVADLLDATGHTYENGVCTGCGATQPGPVITQQPESVQQEVGKKFAITVKVEGEGLTYQWYIKEAGAKAFKVSVNKTSSYSYTMQTYMHNRQVYCVITDANGNSVQTETATITRPPQALRIVEQPKDAQANIGEKFSISPKVEGDGLTYQWYVKESGAKAFKVSSNKTASYAYTMQSYMKGRQVYCVITDKYGNSVTTDVTTISLPPVELKILQQPTDVYAAKGEKFSISFEVQGDGLTYQWYYKESYMKDFKPSNNKTSAYAYSMQTYMNNRQVYCVITDKYGNQVVTEVVTIHLEK